MVSHYVAQTGFHLVILAILLPQPYEFRVYSCVSFKKHLSHPVKHTRKLWIQVRVEGHIVFFFGRGTRSYTAVQAGMEHCSPLVLALVSVRIRCESLCSGELMEFPTGCPETQVANDL